MSGISIGGINLQEIAKHDFAKAAQELFKNCFERVSESKSLKMSIQDEIDMKKISIALCYKIENEEPTTEWRVFYDGKKVLCGVRNAFGVKKYQERWPIHRILDPLIAGLYVAVSFEKHLLGIIELAMDQFEQPYENGKIVMTYDGVVAGKFFIFNGLDFINTVDFEVINAVREELKHADPDELKQLLKENKINIPITNT